MIKEVLADSHDRMEKTIEALRHDLMAIRTGRASPALVEHLHVEYYGAPTPLLQLATISVPEPQQILIRPHARGDIKAIEKAISESDLRLTPNNDGQSIRLNIPPLNEERRRELTKVVNKRGEEARVSIRNIRRDAIQDMRDLEKEHLISEDDLKRGQEQVQERTDHYIEQVDQIIKEKDKEIMTV
ncbi:MAG: ribosome recycling factor [Anaerolineales bacterium]|nr:ribosome recycling factor [Anaerolineales bacterium]